MPPVRRKPSRNSGLLTAGDLAHARTRAYQRRVDETRRMLAELPERCAAAISWGKDSIVLLHLLQEERPDITIVHLRNHGPERPPGLDQTRDEAIARWQLHPHLPSWESVEQMGKETGLGLSRAHQGWTPWLCRQTSPARRRTPSREPTQWSTRSTRGSAPGSPTPERSSRCPRPSSDPPSPRVSHRPRTCYLEVPCETPVHAWLATGTVFAEPQTSVQVQALRAVTGRNFARWRDAITKEIKADHVCGAMRARESNRRLFAIIQHGTTWQPAKHRKWDIPTSHPLAWWTTADVWAHIALHELPVPRHYRWAAAHGWDRDRVRSEPGFKPIEWDPSQAEFWSRAEPQMWRTLLAVVPGFHPDLLVGKRRTTTGVRNKHQVNRIERARTARTARQNAPKPVGTTETLRTNTTGAHSGSQGRSRRPDGTVGGGPPADGNSSQPAGARTATRPVLTEESHSSPTP